MPVSEEIEHRLSVSKAVHCADEGTKIFDSLAGVTHTIGNRSYCNFMQQSGGLESERRAYGGRKERGSKHCRGS